MKGWRVGGHPSRSHVMTEEEAGNDGVCPRLAGMQRMHKREQQHVTERQGSVQEHGRSWTPSKASESYRSQRGGGLKRVTRAMMEPTGQKILMAV